MIIYFDIFFKCNFFYSRSVSSRKEIPSNNKSAVVDDDITFRIDGEKMSKNRYFFGGELKSAIKSKSSRGPKESSRKPRKTAVDIFLEDQGPYSRKLYGPAPNGGGGVGKFVTFCFYDRFSIGKNHPFIGVFESENLHHHFSNQKYPSNIFSISHKHTEL